MKEPHAQLHPEDANQGDESLQVDWVGGSENGKAFSYIL